MAAVSSHHLCEPSTVPALNRPLLGTDVPHAAQFLKQLTRGAVARDTDPSSMIIMRKYFLSRAVSDHDRPVSVGIFRRLPIHIFQCHAQMMSVGDHPKRRASETEFELLVPRGKGLLQFLGDAFEQRGDIAFLPCLARPCGVGLRTSSRPSTYSDPALIARQDAF